MELTKILAEVGDENIGLQNLAQCATKMNYNQKKGYSYTFSTDQSFGPQAVQRARVESSGSPFRMVGNQGIPDSSLKTVLQ